MHLVRMLRREYAPALNEDAGLEKDFQALDAVHFGLRPQANGLEGLFGSIFGSMLG